MIRPACVSASGGKRLFLRHNSIARLRVNRTLKSAAKGVSPSGGAGSLRGWVYSEKNPMVWRRNALARSSRKVDTSTRLSKIWLVVRQGCRRGGGGPPSRSSTSANLRRTMFPELSGGCGGIHWAHVMFQSGLEQVVVLSELPFLPVPQFLLMFSKVLKPEADLMEASGKRGGRKIQLLFSAG